MSIITKKKVAKELTDYMCKSRVFVDDNGNLKIYIAKVPTADRESIIDLPGKLVSINKNKYNSSNCIGLYFHQKHNLTELTVKEIIETIISSHSSFLESRLASYELQVINVESRNKIVFDVCFFFFFLFFFFFFFFFGKTHYWFYLI